jgi:hypothetical protein
MASWPSETKPQRTKTSRIPKSVFFIALKFNKLMEKILSTPPFFEPQNTGAGFQTKY